jgi:hypothetical protein
VLDGALGLMAGLSEQKDTSEVRVLLAVQWQWAWAGHAVSYVQLADLPSVDYPVLHSNCQVIT